MFTKAKFDTKMVGGGQKLESFSFHIYFDCFFGHFFLAKIEKLRKIHLLQFFSEV